MQSKPYCPVSLAALVAFGFLVAAPLRAQTVLSGDHVIAGGLVVDGNASAEHVSSVSTQGDAAFYGRQVGGAFANAQPIFSAVTDNTNGAANWFFRGKVGGDSGTETFSVRADGVIKSAALAPGGTANVLLAVTPDGTLVHASFDNASVVSGGLTAVGPVAWGGIYRNMNGVMVPSIVSTGSALAGGGINESGWISSTGPGSISMGFAAGSAPILSSGVGSVALGYQNGGIGLKSTGLGSFAVGYAGQDGNAGIISSGYGSVAMGAASNSDTVSSGIASFALGQDLQATADNAFALGSSFSNSTPSTFKVGFSSIPTLTVTATQVGIGTTAPTAKLDVAGDAKVQGSLTVGGAPVLTATGNGSGLTGLNASQLSTGTVPISALPSTVVLATATQTLTNKTLQNTTFMGSVGIGTTVAAAPLQVVALSQEGAIRIDTGGNDLNSLIDFYYAGYKGMRFGFVGGETGDAVMWNYNTTNTIFGTSDIERMRIDSVGNVGIGTIAPTERIEVAGNAKISGTVTAAAVTSTAITVNTVTVKTVLRVPQSGDLSMGSFMAGSNPAN